MVTGPLQGPDLKGNEAFKSHTFGGATEPQRDLIIAEYAAVFRRLDELGKSVMTLRYVAPSNSPAAKERFLSDPAIVNPEFEYPKIPDDLSVLRAALRDATIPTSHIALSRFVEDRIDGYLASLDIIEGRDSGRVRELTIKRYGSPSPELVAAAKWILLQTSAAVAGELTVPSSEVKAALETQMKELGLNDWKVEFGSNHATTVYPGERFVRVNEARRFREGDDVALGASIIGVRALRSSNGWNQPIPVFATATGDLGTEEGLMLFAEQAAGRPKSQKLRDYALRTICTASVVGGSTFRETFDLLRKNGLNDDAAWDMTLQGHRAGGFIKDHMYLEGYLKVAEFIEQGGDVSKLFVGKVGVQDIPLINDLMAAKLIEPAKRLPYRLR